MPTKCLQKYEFGVDLPFELLFYKQHCNRYVPRYNNLINFCLYLIKSQNLDQLNQSPRSEKTKPKFTLPNTLNSLNRKHKK